MELAEYWRILRAHWVGVAAIVGLAMAAAGVFTMTQPKVYAANASGFVTTGGNSTNPALGSVSDSLAKSRATSYVDIAKSRSTAQQVIEELELTDSPATLVSNITVTQPEDTVLIKITARAPTPQQAQTLADAWVNALATQVTELEDPSGRGGEGVLELVPVESAELPTSPVSPDPQRNLALGAAVGLLLGIGYALIRHSVDRRLRSKEAIEAKFPVNVVGTIPAAEVLDCKEGQRAAMAVSGPDIPQRATASESFRKLRTNLMYMKVDDPPQIVVVTSPLPGDGKSTVAANLAAAVDYTGEPVVLIDADLRRPTVATSFGLAEGVGLSDVLAGRISLANALQRSPAHPNLRILAAGSIPPNPSELLGSKAMRDLLRTLAADGLVVLDAPPLLPVTDAAVLSTQADGAFVVISAGRTTDDQLGQCLDHLNSVGGTTLGVVLNRVSKRESSYGGYYGGYYGRASSDAAAAAPEDTEQLEPAHRGGGRRRARADHR